LRSSTRRSRRHVAVRSAIFMRSACPACSVQQSRHAGGVHGVVLTGTPRNAVVTQFPACPVHPACRSAAHAVASPCLSCAVSSIAIPGPTRSPSASGTHAAASPASLARSSLQSHREAPRLQEKSGNSGPPASSSRRNLGVSGEQTIRRAFWPGVVLTRRRETREFCRDVPACQQVPD